MQNLVRLAIYVFLAIFTATAILTLFGLGLLWWGSVHAEANAITLPYFGWLLAITIGESIAFIFFFARSGMKYLPEVKSHANEEETLSFMRDFISKGSSVTIVSNRVAWLRKSPLTRDAVAEIARQGTQLEIITPAVVAEDIRLPLQEAGAHFYVTGESMPPESRFTLVDGHRSGGERLAIARGGHPNHEISIFDNNSGPQIIAMAKDIIQKSKGLTRAGAMDSRR